MARAAGDSWAGACGSTLRRRLDSWHATALLRQVHTVLIRMVRAGPEAKPWDVVVDSCSVRAKRGGELTGPNPTDRGKPGTKYHVVVSTEGVPLGAIPSAANVHDTRLFLHLLRLALAVCAAIGTLYGDAGYDSAENRSLCLQDGIQPQIRRTGEAHGTARVWGRSAAWSSTIVRGCWPTSAWIGVRTGSATSSWPC